MSQAYRDPSLIIGAHFEAEDDDLTLVVPGGIGSTIQFHGRIAGSPIEDGSGFIRARPALVVLVHNKWFEVEQTIAEIRIRRGAHARKLGEPLARG